MKIERIVIHCSASYYKQSYSFESCRNDHIHLRGFRDIGYSVYIERSGKTTLGRPFGEILAHAKGFNTNSIAICYEGGLGDDLKAEDTRTPQQKQILLNTLMF